MESTNDYQATVFKFTSRNNATMVKTHGISRLYLFLFEGNAVVADPLAGALGNFLSQSDATGVLTS